MGSGLNNIYPKENYNLYKNIIKKGGTVISEYPPDVEANPKNFPQRNRIISGLSNGILVVEGKYRSGTTITAKYGFKQEKRVFCIPHSIFDTYGTGPNSLIKKGAILVTKPKEIIEFLGIKENIKNKTKHEDEILKLLENDILTKEEIARKLKRSISEINQRITILELEEKIEENSGKGYRIIE